MEDYRPLLQEHFLFRNAEEALEEALTLPVSAFRRGDAICQPETEELALGIVLRGRAEAAAERRAQTVLSRFGPGDTFGAAALFGGGHYVSRIRAVTGCTVLFLPEKRLRKWFSRWPQMAVNYVAFLSGRVRFLNEKIAIFTADDAQQRLYRWLCDNCGDGGCLPPGLNLSKLAAELSMGRTSLYRALDALENAGLIVRAGKRIEVMV